MERLVRRGDIYYLDFGRTIGSEQSGVRPVIVVSNKMANRYSPTVLVSPITTSFSKKELPTHVKLNCKECGLKRDSQVLLEQIYTADKSRLGTYLGSVDKETMDKIDIAAEISIQVGSGKTKYEREEVKILMDKVRNITKLDNFIRQWLSYGRDVREIKRDMEDRESRINDLEVFARGFGFDYKEFYNPASIREVGNLNVMVG